MIEEVRQQWAFYRDRRPDTHTATWSHPGGVGMATVIAGGTVVTATETMAADVLIDGEKVVAIAARTECRSGPRNR